MRVLPHVRVIVLAASACNASTPAPPRSPAANAAGPPRDGAPASVAGPDRVISCAKNLLRPWTELPQTPQLPTPKERGYAPVNGARIFYARFGGGTPVVLLHGGLANANYWGIQIPAIAESYDVIAIDFRGHGRSTLPPGPLSYDLLASDVSGVLKHLKLANAAIVGWSDGAIVGLTLAMKNPELVTKVFAFGANFNPGGLIAGGSHSPVFATYTARTAREYRALSPQPDAYPILQRGMVRMWSTEPDFSRIRLATIKAPTTIADGDHDEIIKLQHTRELAAAIPSARLVIQPCVSHFSMLQDPRQFTDDVMTFLGN